jgi:hypothetical protein
LVDPELSQINRYIALAAKDGLRIRYVIDTVVAEVGCGNRVTLGESARFS